ncbi:MAG: hypothetical protein GC168_15075 [Candidatus Hydrogenedens sp.]|nr:hypothetical protein [Candidatus Hydrogenedens sp.]
MMRRFLLMLVFVGCPFVAQAASDAEEAAAVPIQDGGRIKPLATFARFSLLQLSGRTTLALDDGTRLDAMAWLLEVLLHTDTARKREVFLIENPELMESLSLPHDRPRQRFSYATLRTSRSTLIGIAAQLSSERDEQLTPAQKQTLRLADNLRLFESLTTSLVPLASGDALLSDALAQPERLRTDPALRRFLLLQADSPLRVIPPDPTSDAPHTWQTPGGLVQRALAGQPPTAPQLDAVRALERAAGAKDDASLAEAFAALHASSAQLMAGNREYEQLPRELHFYALRPFYWATMLYVAALLLAGIGVLVPSRRWLHHLLLLALAAPWLLHVYGVVLRCIIRGRPPVSTLYETLLFVSAVAVALALAAEVLTRKRIAAAFGALLGAAGLFLASRYEAIDRGDTMPSLTAVLDTNFWLSTHVTTVTIGYAAGLLAGAIAHLYLLGKAFGYRPRDPDFYPYLTRTVYGVFCFGLIFATVGTVLGGVWANESWGRFWGWDPKENGALMIVLWGLAVLHARMGGYIRDYGLHMAALFGGVVVAFSWFGVNLLGVGLHTYGFTSGIQIALRQFYLVESLVLAVGAFGWLREQGIVRIGPGDRR